MVATKLFVTKGKSNKILNLDSLDYEDGEDWEEVLKDKIGKVLNNPENFEIIKLRQVEIEDVKAILKVCGSETKEFVWAHVDEIKALELIETFNLMPKLESFTYYDDDGHAPEISGIEVVEGTLNLPNLKTLHISCSNSIYELLNKVLPENSITEYSGYDSDFASKQKNSIKEFASDELELVKMFELEHLEISVFNPPPEDVSEALSSQPKLKSLEMEALTLKAYIDGIEKLSQLESLRFTELDTVRDKICTSADAKKLKNIKTLKVLELQSSPSLNFWGSFLNEKHESLQKLTLASYGGDVNLTAEIFENLPNLVYLNLTKPTLKFNTFAKFLPNLEELHISFDDKILELNFCELDTGIVSKSLKKIHIEIDWRNRIEELLEILEICPNLEELKLDNEGCGGQTESSDGDVKLLKRLNKVKTLKSLSLSEIRLKDFSSIYTQVAQELKELSIKLKFAEIKFSYWFNLGEIPFSFSPMMEMLRDDFKVHENFNFYEWE